MKVLYSQLKKYLPELKASAREVADTFTLIGYMIDKFHEVEFLNEKDFLLDLEVRQNRADLLGVEGLARELSAYYQIPLIKYLPNIKLKTNLYKLPFEIKAINSVKRVMAIKVNNITIKESPVWLKEYLSFYDINSINNLVDLTNYVMLQTGHASHVFDYNLIGDKLIWDIDSKYKNFTTLNGQEVILQDNILVISDGKRPLSLSFIGGKVDATSNKTKNIIIEIGIYDAGLVRKNSRELRISTEAGSRLEKYMDPESIPEAMQVLVDLIIQECGGEIGSDLYDSYLQLSRRFDIEVNLDKVQQIAGIKISYEESINYLYRLGFIIKDKLENKIIVNRPINRLDIEMEEDVFEEIIRLKGFNNLPINNLLTSVVNDVTPSHIILMDKIASILISNGFDEVRSWILVDGQENIKSNFLKSKEVKVTNSINDEVPFLRQSISVSLLGQLKTYIKNSIPDIQLFEMGKIFTKFDKYSEQNSLGLIIEGNKINDLKIKLEILLRSVGIDNIIYKSEDNPPESAHPKTAWNIIINKINIGIIYLTNTNIHTLASLAEINIDLIDKILNTKDQDNITKEITKKIITLDANMETNKIININIVIIEKLHIYKNNIWKWLVIDTYKVDNNALRYTIRVSYINLSDQEAKKLHKEIFGSI